VQSHLARGGAHYQLFSAGFQCPCTPVYLDKRILPNLVFTQNFAFVMSESILSIDGKQVDFNDMITVIVKCFNCSRMNGCESD